MVGVRAQEHAPSRSGGLGNSPNDRASRARLPHRRIASLSAQPLMLEGTQEPSTEEPPPRQEGARGALVAGHEFRRGKKRGLLVLAKGLGRAELQGFEELVWLSTGTGRLLRTS